MSHLVICAYISLFCSLNSALVVVRFFMPCVSIDGGVEKCPAVLCEFGSSPNCVKDTKIGLLKTT